MHAAGDLSYHSAAQSLAWKDDRANASRSRVPRANSWVTLKAAYHNADPVISCKEVS